jgi:hypothetical protein
MPQTQTSTPVSPAANMLAGDAALAAPDFDYALGCECADPHLQIESWTREAAIREPGTAESHH